MNDNRDGLCIKQHRHEGTASLGYAAARRWSVLMVKTHSTLRSSDVGFVKPCAVRGRPLDRLEVHLCQILLGRKKLAAYFQSFRRAGPRLLLHSPAATLSPDVPHPALSFWLLPCSIFSYDLCLLPAHIPPPNFSATVLKLRSREMQLLMAQPRLNQTLWAQGTVVRVLTNLPGPSDAQLSLSTLLGSLTYNPIPPAA